MSTQASQQLSSILLQSVAVQSDLSQLAQGQSQLALTQSGISTSVSNVSANVAQIVASISAAVANLPIASSGGGGSTVTGQPFIATDASTMRFQGGGRQLSLEADCATINPCQVLQALNNLGNL
jgi:hypothetical protein